MEEVLDGIKRLGPATGDVFFRLGLELLPFLLPEPGLVAVDRLLGDKHNGIIDDLRQNDAPLLESELSPHR